MNNVEMRKFVSSIIVASKNLKREAREIELSNLPKCLRCNSVCHCDMIESKKQKIEFVQTGFCPDCQNEIFWGK